MPRYIRVADSERQAVHDDLRFVLVAGCRHHLWIDDMHFRETQRPADISVGDTFYDAEGAAKVFEVTAIDKSNTGLEVEIEYLYLEGQSWEEAAGKSDRVSLALLRGEETEVKARGFPPVPLEPAA